MLSIRFHRGRDVSGRILIQQYLQKLAKSGITISQTGLSHPYFLGDHDMQIAAENKIDWFDLEISIRIGEWNIPFIRFKRFILNGIRIQTPKW